MLFLVFVGGAISKHEERHKRQLAEARYAIWGEMQLAKRIQTALLTAKPTIPGFDVAAHLAAADEVGGDYYDVIHAGNRDWVVIGDVSGHGFFFQAEDGIRDLYVTGVQTCALPISPTTRQGLRHPDQYGQSSLS